MTEPFRLTEGEAEDSFELPSSAPSWIERVKEADAQAEIAYWQAVEDEGFSAWLALVAIAAELRAQRIARRPGAGRY